MIINHLHWTMAPSNRISTAKSEVECAVSKLLIKYLGRVVLGEIPNLAYYRIPSQVSYLV